MSRTLRRAENAQFTTQTAPGKPLSMQPNLRVSATNDVYVRPKTDCSQLSLPLGTKVKQKKKLKNRKLEIKTDMLKRNGADRESAKSVLMKKESLLSITFYSMLGSSYLQRNRQRLLAMDFTREREPFLISMSICFKG